MLLFDWGDGTDSNWIKTPTFGSIKATHEYIEQRTYEIKVKAIDQFGAESYWSEPLVISMPKNKSINEFNPWISRLIKHFPILGFLL